MPAWLEWLDDPWGIVWRASNLVRGFSPRRMVRLAAGLGRNLHYQRPLFIVGASRSGTSMLFRLLRESRSLGSLPGEGHNLWRAFHHPRHSGWESDAVGPGQLRFGEKRFVKACLHSHFEGFRFVEKTPENAFRIPYLLDLFPDALFVVMWRDPCDVINSLINGWRDSAGRFRSYFVPEDLQIPGYRHRRQWCFALIKGWRQLRSSAIPEIAFAQWAAYTQALADWRSRLPPERWMEVRLEDMLDAPTETAQKICAFAAIDFEEPMQRRLDDLLARPAQALSPPRRHKWRRENSAEIEALLPAIQQLAPLAGYRIERDADGLWSASLSAPENGRLIAE